MKVTFLDEAFWDLPWASRWAYERCSIPSALCPFLRELLQPDGKPHYIRPGTLQKQGSNLYWGGGL